MPPWWGMLSLTPEPTRAAYGDRGGGGVWMRVVDCWARLRVKGEGEE